MREQKQEEQKRKQENETKREQEITKPKKIHDEMTKMTIVESEKLLYLYNEQRTYLDEGRSLREELKYYQEKEREPMIIPPPRRDPNIIRIIKNDNPELLRIQEQIKDNNIRLRMLADEIQNIKEYQNPMVALRDKIADGVRKKMLANKIKKIKEYQDPMFKLRQKTDLGDEDNDIDDEDIDDEDEDNDNDDEDDEVVDMNNIIIEDLYNNSLITKHSDGFNEWLRGWLKKFEKQQK
jgi:hypothetical protein